jgi:hypothetical protein
VSSCGAHVNTANGTPKSTWLIKYVEVLGCTSMMVSLKFHTFDVFDSWRLMVRISVLTAFRSCASLGLPALGSESLRRTFVIMS